jgi:hypothetical protein
MSRLESIDARNWEEFVGSPAAVLMLGKSDCEACKAWTDELLAFLEQDQAWRHVRFGKLLLDTPGLVAFKRANPWLAEVDALPFNVIYVGGKPVKRFAGAGTDRLVSRLAGAVGAPA